MTTRLALLDLVARTGMDARQASALWRLAGLDGMPPQAPARLRAGMTLAGVGCAGLGLMFWVAANWALLSRLQQFTLLQSLVLAPCAVLAAYGRGRAALALLGFVATGGLFAYFGQTYQTGADPWQLFAVWALLGFPLACCARADSVWFAWTVVILVAIVLCKHAYAGVFHEVHEGVPVAILAAAGAMSTTLFLRTIARRYLGAGKWAFGLALAVTTAWMTANALLSLSDYLPDYDNYWFSLACAGLAAAALAQIEPFDVFAASIVALGLNVLLVAGLAKVVLKDWSSADWTIGLLMIGLAAAGLLAGSVKFIIALVRANAAPKHVGSV